MLHKCNHNKSNKRVGQKLYSGRKSISHTHARESWTCIKPVASLQLLKGCKDATHIHLPVMRNFHLKCITEPQLSASCRKCVPEPLKRFWNTSFSSASRPLLVTQAVIELWVGSYSLKLQSASLFSPQMFITWMDSLHCIKYPSGFMYKAHFVKCRWLHCCQGWGFESQLGGQQQ